MPAIETQALSKNFGSLRHPLRVVRDLNLTVPAGIVFGCLGPNGAGKTTTIRMLTGVLPASSGRGWVAGEDLRYPDRVKARIGYANQAASIYGDLTIQENLRFKAALFLEPREVTRAIDRVMDQLGLRERRHRLGSQLSGGWRQRLSIANAIVHSPPILFLDEPTAGLDPVGRRDLWDAIYALSAEGTTVFVTTHYMDEAERCQRLAMLANGKVLAEGTPLALRSAVPGNFYDVTTVDLGTSLRQAKAIEQVRDAWITGSSLRVAALSPLTEMTLQELGTSYRQVSPTLEDAFVALAGKDVAR
ncbi:MAG: ABC transporter ATP-binding protein [Cyanobacteria bacterium NC_groundwater_1444_Ag_S-0.65um_54_12]|nr:ABC transporter ATP-binding protein [Cyanobacteria bacterium NC_groundwater_1444_Ag_S-0.65um_54_12]